jgi:hypothetical protein
MSDPSIIPDPDCRDGKHASCNGSGLDLVTDQAVDCPCSCHEAATKWKAGDRVAMHEVALGWVVMEADAARRVGVDESTPGWSFAVVVDDSDTPTRPSVEHPEDA